MSSNHPANTYRIQFNKDFPIDSLLKIEEYLRKLGVQTIYASPIFEAIPGSSHGYDVTNPQRINPEITSLEQLKETITRFRSMDIYWLQDIVPNHMAFHQNNAWLMDVLEKGSRSLYASFFDIDLREGNLMVPFLGAPMATLIDQHELSVIYRNNRLQLKYFANLYPLNGAGYEAVLTALDANAPEACKQLKNDFLNAEGITDPSAYRKEWESLLFRFHKLNEAKEGAAWLEYSLQQINSNPGQLKLLAAGQYYRLCSWRETDQSINYRRFFLVNGLICLNIQGENVFSEYHQLIKSLVEDDLFTGIRVDHIDGLYDPAGYLERLKNLSGLPVYNVVEKILEPWETLPSQWKTEGTTGYDFLAFVNNLFTNMKNGGRFIEFYQQLVDDHRPVAEQVSDKKEMILKQFMGGELDNLTHQLLSIVDKNSFARVTEGDLKEVVAQFLVHCPVYRYYGNRSPFDTEENDAIRKILAKMREHAKNGIEGIKVLEKVLLETPLNVDEDTTQKVLHFYKRCMQFTGPLMAKGVEDTLMYTYNAFIVHNEVGDSPSLFGVSSNEFHEAMKKRMAEWPLTLNATSTHDTKRGEDARSRLNVLSDVPDEWFDIVSRWFKMNISLKENNTPSVNEEYLIYQSLVGSYPMSGELDSNFIERCEVYLVKALREAKVNSGWSSPNEDYEKGCTGFLKALLQNDCFKKSFVSFHERIVDFGIMNSLAQLVLKFTCPGIPDTYQGCESWDLSFVDPDNRRAVEFNKHVALLNALESIPAGSNEDLIQLLWKNRYSGQVKIWATQRLLKLRKQHSRFFSKAEYVPLKIEGELERFVMAFARHYEQKWLLVVVPLHLAELCKHQDVKEVHGIDWKDTEIVLPSALGPLGEDMLFGDNIEMERKVSLKTAFQYFPLALLSVGLQST